MKVGIKYCGGCNSNYNRNDAVRQIVERYPEIDFETINQDVYYNCILIINGCGRSCAGHKRLKANNKIFINSLNDINELKRKIKSMI